MRHFILFSILFLMCASCRSHKATELSESLSVDQVSISKVNEQLTNVSDTKLNYSLSFDSIEIFIQRVWGLPLSQTIVPQEANDSLVSQGASSSLYEVNFAKPDRPQTEIIGIKAYNAKASGSSQSKDSLGLTSDLTLHQSSHEEASKEETISSETEPVFDPPKIWALVIWTFIIGAVIFLIVFFINRKPNP